MILLMAISCKEVSYHDSFEFVFFSFNPLINNVIQDFGEWKWLYGKCKLTISVSLKPCFTIIFQQYVTGRLTHMELAPWGTPMTGFWRGTEVCTLSAGAPAHPRTGALAVTMASTPQDHTVKVRLKQQFCKCFTVKKLCISKTKSIICSCFTILNSEVLNPS